MGHSFLYSFLLHLSVLLFLGLQVNMPDFQKKEQPKFVILDLKNLKIQKETVLPMRPRKSTPKKSADKKDIQTSLPKKDVPQPVVKPKIPPKPVTVPPQKKEADENAVRLKLQEEAKKKADIKRKEEQKKVEEKRKKEQRIAEQKKAEKLKKEAERKAKKKAEQEMQSLFASVEQIETSVQKEEKESKKQKEEEQSFQESIHAFAEESRPLLAQEIGIGEKEHIAHLLRECWNLDAGVQNIEQMIIELIVHLDLNGRVTKVELADKNRLKTDKTFRSVAESAERAVFICDQKEKESPFKILAEKYPDSYTLWHKILFTFNPTNGGGVS